MDPEAVYKPFEHWADIDTMNTATDSTMSSSVSINTFTNEINLDWEHSALREKYPALQDAWEKYKMILHMCEQEEMTNYENKH